MNKRPLGFTTGIQVMKLRDLVPLYLIDNEIRTYLEETERRVNLSDLAGWRIQFYALYTGGDYIGVFKGVRTYKSDMTKEVSLLVSIPNKTQAKYGLGDEHFIPRRNAFPADKYHLIDPEFSHYEDLQAYITASVLRAIDLALTRGISVQGKKIYAKNGSFEK